MKKKTIYWIFFGITLFLIIGATVITLLVGWEKLNLLFWIVLGVNGLGWLIVLIIYFATLNPTIPQEKLNAKNLIEKAVISIREDINYSDNFIPDEHETGRYGLGGKETPVLYVGGYLTEQKCRGTVIINMNNPDETIIKKNLSESTIDKLKNIIAEHPDTQSRESIERLDPFGKVTERINRPMPSSQKERDELEKKKAEEDMAT